MAKKKNKSLLPKRIAGVRVPKALRKGRAGRFLTSPAGLAVVAEALIAAGAFKAARKADPNSEVGRLRDHPLDEFKRLADEARDKGGASTDALRGAFTAATEAFAEALRHSADALEGGSKKSEARGAARAAH